MYADATVAVDPAVRTRLAQNTYVYLLRQLLFCFLLQFGTALLCLCSGLLQLSL